MRLRSESSSRAVLEGSLANATEAAAAARAEAEALRAELSARDREVARLSSELEYQRQHALQPSAHRTTSEPSTDSMAAVESWLAEALAARDQAVDRALAAEARANDLGRQVATLTARLGDLDLDLAHTRRLLESREGHIQDLEAALGESRAQLGQGELGSPAVKATADARQLLAEVERLTDTWRGAVGSRDSQLAALEEDVAGLMRQLAAATGRCSELEDELGRAQARAGAGEVR